MRQALLLFLLTVGVSSCSAIPVKRDYDNSLDFGQMETYSWRTETGPADSLMDERIRQAVADQLGEKGFQPVASGADLVVAYRYATEIEAPTDRVRTGVGIGGGSGGMFGGISVGVGVGRQDHEDEILEIDFLDPQTGKQVWQGRSRRRLSETSDPDRLTKRIDAWVKTILSKFPPKPKR